MTIFEALQSMVEVDNDNLLEKALLERGVADISATYALSHQQSVELAAADVYFVLAHHPEFTEGSRAISYNKGALLAMRRQILRKYGLSSDGTVSVPRDSRYNKQW